MTKVFKEDDEIISELYKKFGNITKVSKIFGVSTDTIRRSLVRSETTLLCNPGGSKKVNINYFDSIDSENKSYFLGLLFSDGSIRPCKDANSWRIYLGLVEDDLYLIEEFKKDIGSNHKIWSYVCDSGKNMYKISFRNKYMGDTLISKGLLPGKSKFSEFPKYLNDDLSFHFIRGGCLMAMAQLVLIPKTHIIIFLYMEMKIFLKGYHYFYVSFI